VVRAVHESRVSSSNPLTPISAVCRGWSSTLSDVDRPRGYAITWSIMNTTHQTSTIPLDRILERPGLNCRFGGLEVEELAKSIADIGLLHPPLVVRANDRPAISETEFYYYVIHGHRRVKAMRMLRLIEGVFFVAPPDFPLSEQYIINLAENVRENLTPAELADRCCTIADAATRSGKAITSEELGKRIGYSSSHVRNLMRLRRGLHPDLWEMMVRTGHHAAISKLLQVVNEPVWQQIDVWKQMWQTVEEKKALGTVAVSDKKKSWRSVAAELVKRAPPEHAAGARWLLGELSAWLARADVDRSLS